MDKYWIHTKTKRNRKKEIIGGYPCYVGDGGITFGYGHCIKKDWRNLGNNATILSKYFSKNIDHIKYDDGLGVPHQPGEDANKEKIPTDFNRLEAVVNQILKEKLSALRQQEKNTASPSEKLHKTEEIPSMDGFLDDSEDGLAAITNSIAAFRSAEIK